jgi:hypothetical protein
MSVFDVDLLIQDFITTNRSNRQHYLWHQLSNRCFIEGAPRKVLSYKSGERTLYALAEHMDMPMGDILRITLTVPKLPVESSPFRFDCLRMMAQQTHTSIVDDVTNAGLIIVTVSTKHKGHIDVVFVIKESTGDVNPLLC